MRLPSLPSPTRMRRVAVLAPHWATRQVVARLGIAGTMEFAGDLPAPDGPAAEALRRLERAGVSSRGEPRIAEVEPDVAQLEALASVDLLAGEVELERRRQLAIEHGDVSVYVGWTPEASVEPARTALASLSAAMVELDTPSGEEPPTQLAEVRTARAFRPIVETYGVLPYSDIDPTAFAAVAFIVMFGMMFGDLGHGALLLLAGLALTRSRRGRLAGFASAGPLLVAGGISGSTFGVLYGEFFGPTGVLSPVWLNPLDEPLVLLTAALIFGSGLLAVSYLIGTVNRWREGGAAAALYSQTAVAGTLLFAATTAAAAGIWFGIGALVFISPALAAAALILLFIGARAEAGGGGIGIAMGAVEVFDGVVRLGSNLVSFSRLAAFGMTHAALSRVVWEGSTALAGGLIGWALAAIVFLGGTAAAIALEGLVAGIQALRLEYYELFSRMLGREGRRFEPFVLRPDAQPSVVAAEETS